MREFWGILGNSAYARLFRIVTVIRNIMALITSTMGLLEHFLLPSWGTVVGAMAVAVSENLACPLMKTVLFG